MLRRLCGAAGAIVAVVALVAPGTAAAAGPPLTVPEAQLSQALSCQRLAGATRSTVLFVPGTGETPAMYSWNWLRYAAQRNWPVCTVALPGSSMLDIQTAAEYVTYAIRRIASQTGRRVQIVGHSQGGMLPRWSLRFWPDTRPLVDDLIGLRPSNHGTETAVAACGLGSCAASVWQQRSNANFIAALNRGAETFAGPSYTVAFTRFDEVVVPNQDAATGSSALRTGAGARSNIRNQDICAANTAEHLAMGTFDPVAHAVAVDALDHPGPANPARIDRAVCLRTLMPGVNPATFPADFTGLLLSVGAAFGSAPQLRAEPPLRCYVTNSCPASDRARAALTLSPGRVTRDRSTRVTLRGTVIAGSGRRTPARGGTVAFAGRRLTLSSTGTASLTVRFASVGTRRALLTVPTVGEAGASLRVVRPVRRGGGGGGFTG